MGHYNFRKDIKRAKKVNKVYASLILSVENISLLEFAPDKTFHDWDLIQYYENNKQTIELKEDLKAKQTGNIFVETECRGKFSGITTSKADYFLYIVHNKNGNVEFLKIPTNDLKMIMNQSGVRKQFAGDTGSRTSGYVIAISHLENYKIYSIEESKFEEKVDLMND